MTRKKLFDTVQFKQGRFLFLEEHLARMKASAKAFGLTRARVRFVLEPFPFFPSSAYAKGICLIISRGVKSLPYPKSLHKTEPRPHIERAKKELARRGGDEIILCNRAGRVTECSTSNIFIAKNGILMTAPVKEGILPGVTRQNILVLAKKLRIKVSQRPLEKKDIFEADEVFLTSSLKDVIPVRAIEGKKIGKGVPGPITKRLMRAYRQLLTS